MMMTQVTQDTAQLQLCLARLDAIFRVLGFWTDG